MVQSPHFEEPKITSQQFPLGALRCLSQSVRDFDKLERMSSEAKVFWWLDAFGGSFMNDIMLSYLVTVMLVLHEIADALSNSILDDSIALL